jgi:hypothetical protein
MHSTTPTSHTVALCSFWPLVNAFLLESTCQHDLVQLHHPCKGQRIMWLQDRLGKSVTHVKNQCAACLALRDTFTAVQHARE